MFSKAELMVLSELLEAYSQVASNAGCNDFELKNTKENRNLMEKIAKYLKNEELFFIVGARICTDDMSLISYLQDRIRAEAKAA